MLWITLIMICVAAIGISLLLLRRKSVRHQLILERFRASERYQHIQPALKRCDPNLVDEIVIRPEEMTIRLLNPAGHMMRYRFTAQGQEALPPDQLFALVQAVAMDLPGIGNRKQYAFTRHMGTSEWFTYTILPKRKAMVQQKLLEHQQRKLTSQPLDYTPDHSGGKV